MLQKQIKKNTIDFNSLIIDKPQEIKTIKINDIDIEVKQYLPIEEKKNFVMKVLQQALESSVHYIDPIQIDIIMTLETLNFYTNIEFNDNDAEDIFKLYDIIERQGIIDKVVGAIPEFEYSFLQESVKESLEAYYKYKNSVLGILENVNQDYSNLNLDVNEIQNKLNESSEDIGFLREVMEKMG